MTQITQGAVRAALEARLAGFSAGGDVNVETSPFYEPQPGRGYVSGRVSAYARTPIGVGPDTPHQVTGSYQVNVYRPAVEGVSQAGSVAGAVVALFRRGTALVLGTGPVLTIEQAGEQPAVQYGDWLSIPVTITFSGEEIGA